MTVVGNATLIMVGNTTITGEISEFALSRSFLLGVLWVVAPINQAFGKVRDRYRPYTSWQSFSLGVLWVLVPINQACRGVRDRYRAGHRKVPLIFCVDVFSMQYLRHASNDTLDVCLDGSLHALSGACKQCLVPFLAIRESHLRGW
jgi:hypothetical protein